MGHRLHHDVSMPVVPPTREPKPFKNVMKVAVQERDRVDDISENDLDFIDLGAAPSTAPRLLRRQSSEERAKKSGNIFTHYGGSFDDGDKDKAGTAAKALDAALLEERRKRATLEEELKSLRHQVQELTPRRENSLRCVICFEMLLKDEGIICSDDDEDAAHFTCVECLVNYVTTACEPNGRLASEIVSEAGITSPAGCMPCPMFALPGMGCSGAILPEAKLVGLMGGTPRTSDLAPAQLHGALHCYLRARERLAVDAQMRDEEAYARRRARVTGAQQHDPQEARASDVRPPLLSLRSDFRQASRLEERANAEAQLACQLIQTALLLGLTQTCPYCGLKSRKDDACIHMRCQCSGRFCYACGGRDTDGCTCDSNSLYLHTQRNDWGFADFERTAINRLVQRTGTDQEQPDDPTQPHHALVWFHLRRSAFMIYILRKYILAAITWEAAMRQSPGILEGIFDGFGISDVPENLHSRHPINNSTISSTFGDRCLDRLRTHWMELQRAEVDLGKDSTLPAFVLAVTCPRNRILLRGVARNGRPRKGRCSGQNCRSRVRSDVHFGSLASNYILCDICLAKKDNRSMHGDEEDATAAAAADTEEGEAAATHRTGRRWPLGPFFRWREA